LNRFETLSRRSWELFPALNRRMLEKICFHRIDDAWWAEAPLPEGVDLASYETKAGQIPG
jgi:hypothetical protein